MTRLSASPRILARAALLLGTTAALAACGGRDRPVAGLAAAQAGEMEAGEAVAGANAQHRLEPGGGGGIAAAEHGEGVAIALQHRRVVLVGDR